MAHTEINQNQHTCLTENYQETRSLTQINQELSKHPQHQDQSATTQTQRKSISKPINISLIHSTLPKTNKTGDQFSTLNGLANSQQKQGKHTQLSQHSTNRLKYG